MKKLVSLLTAVLLITSCAIAELPALSKYSDSEILELLDLVQNEVVTRKLEKTASLKGGKYIAGEDIPAGRYTLTFTYRGDWFENLTIYSDRGNGKQKLWEVVTEEDGEFSRVISLENGDQISCSSDFKLTVYAGAVFK